MTVRGSGPDVVLIPGLAASAGIWNATVAAMPGYRYHLVQVAGFAGTAARGNARGRVAGGVADEVARYLAENRLSHAALVGHSMGGSIAMMLAARHPEAAGRVMIVDMVPAPAGPFRVSGPAAMPLARLVGGGFKGWERGRRELQSLVGRFGSTDWLKTQSDVDVVGRSLEELLATDLTADLRRIRVPVTVLYACAEPVKLTCPSIGAVFSRAYAARPGTRLVRVEGSGHTIMADRPAAFRAALKAFLAGR
ncbi:MAG TPA: alpha/beta hydrolase [Allosphingosinicella sp.]|nr:alpha/beta hydrolase [Allosphingosinicella sp.]